MEEETTMIDESETVTSDKWENLILKMLNNPKIVEDVNQLRQSAHLSDAIAVKILKMCLKWIDKCGKTIEEHELR